MIRRSSIFLQCFTCCLVIGLTNALIGSRVLIANTNQYPFVVSISQSIEGGHHSHQYHVCTGTIIHPRSVLTAAHCLAKRKLEDIEVIAGSVNIRDGRKYYPESWITFDQWNHARNWTYRMNDIAVITLEGKGIEVIDPVHIPMVFHSNYNGHNRIRIAGWGETDKGNKVQRLRAASLFLISNEECSRKGTELKGHNFTVPQNYFCSKAQPYVLSSCGDGGAPILAKGNNALLYLIGINIGTCPNLEGYLFNNEEFLHQNLLNSHLHISYYSHFIKDVSK